MPSKIEIVSLVASVIIVVSMIPKNQLYLRIINGIGSAFFIVYGILLLKETNMSTGYSTAILNCLTLILSIYHTVKLIRDKRRTKPMIQEIKNNDSDDTTRTTD